MEVSNRITKDVLVAACEDLFDALDGLVVRFDLEGLAQDGKCKCLQYEDNDNCRHLYARSVRDQAQKALAKRKVKK